MRRVFKLLGFFSTIGSLIAMCWTYAYLPLKVKVPGLSGYQLAIDKHHFFYLVLGVIVCYNLAFYVINSFLRSREVRDEKRAFIQLWIGDFTLLKVAIDIFFISVIVFIGLMNHLEIAKLSSLSYILYLGLGGLFAWMVYFIYAVFSRFKAT